MSQYTNQGGGIIQIFREIKEDMRDVHWLAQRNPVVYNLLGPM